MSDPNLSDALGMFHPLSIENAKLRAEVEKLRVLSSRHLFSRNEARMKVERLKEFMERYGGHLDWCVHAPNDEWCKCGFLEALQECRKEQEGGV